MNVFLKTCPHIFVGDGGTGEVREYACFYLQRIFALNMKVAISPEKWWYLFTKTRDATFEKAVEFADMNIYLSQLYIIKIVE